MKIQKLGFVKGRIQSLKYALKGFTILLKTEDSIKAQLIFFAFSIGLGFYCQISNIEWIFQIFVFGLIFTTEALNTAVEEIADFIHPDFHQKIGKIKDISAGAVTFAVFTAIIVFGIIYLPKIMHYGH